MQIIINRVTIVMSNKKKAKQIKWGTALVVTMINISVFCIWVPAKLGVNDTSVPPSPSSLHVNTDESQIRIHKQVLG